MKSLGPSSTVPSRQNGIVTNQVQGIPEAMSYRLRLRLLLPASAHVASRYQRLEYA
ncbi:MAG: hypothetical protein KatS3mg110_2019 [Pirellulaceae bacterium]|nr:MAG: hypothetical protein KatS3mg110_2019 [Pirellulaceae bacterium]